MFPSHIPPTPELSHTRTAHPAGPGFPRPCTLKSVPAPNGWSPLPPPYAAPWSPDFCSPLPTSTSRRARPTDLPGGGAGVQTGRGSTPGEAIQQGGAGAAPGPRPADPAVGAARAQAGCGLRGSGGAGRGAGRESSRGHRPPPARAAPLYQPARPGPQPPRSSASAGCKAQALAGGRRRGRRGLGLEGGVVGAGPMGQGLWWWAGPLVVGGA